MKVYFIHTVSGQTGPYTLEELKSKSITKETSIWREELSDWVKDGDLPELNVLFIPAPPPFVEKDTEKDSINKTIAPPVPKEPPKDVTSKIIPAAFPAKGKKNMLIIIPVILLVVAAAAYFYFNRSNNKTSDANKEKVIAATSDSSLKKEIVNKDTTKKIILDTLSNWMSTDTSAANKEKGTTSESGFTMGGIPVKKNKEPEKNTTKKKEKKDIIEPQEKKPEKNINVNNETHEVASVRTKNLTITGSFRKNLLFEAVMEGKIQNPNDNISFRNVIVVVQFLNNDGASLGTKQFAQSGVIRGGEIVSFKFKANAPKGTKTARYNVSGSGF